MVPSWWQLAVSLWLLGYATPYAVRALLGRVGVAGYSSVESSTAGEATLEAAMRLLDKMVPSTMTGESPLPGTAATLLAGFASATAVLYVAFLRHSSRGPTRGFNRLRSKAAGSGIEGRKWTTAAKAAERAAEGADVSAGEGGVEVTWLGERELRVLEALGDTLLPGFEIDTTEGADATVEQVRGKLVSISLPAQQTLWSSWFLKGEGQKAVYLVTVLCSQKTVHFMIGTRDNQEHTNPVEHTRHEPSVWPKLKIPVSVR